SKAPKTDTSPKAAKAKGGRKGPKTNLAAGAFKERALPLHINITHTPPVLDDEGTVTIASQDPGFVGTSTLLPGTFATGSYGWKGNKRFTVEINNPDGGGKEKVHVMLTMNATVIGSKDAKEDEPGDAEATAADEPSDEAKEAMEE
ncbi:uncharacterized protein BXZ73DRAFT_4386, partial [Epithele typhae]|uniref:uncharacterized protein n=1 Tax=Epithele typhae TaxID=378194 RepID=UPI002007788B